MAQGVVRRRVLRTVLVVCGALLAALCGCARGGSAPSDGRQDEVTLVVGEGVSPLAADILRKTLVRATAARDSEPLFQVEDVPARGFEGVRKRRSLVLLVNLSAPGAIARATREVLTSDEAGDAGAGTGSFFVKRDPWAPGQTVLFLPGSSAQDVVGLVEGRSEKVRDALLSVAKDRIARDLFRDGEDKDAMAQIAGAVGGTIRVPARGWKLDRSRAGEGIVRLEGPRPGCALTIAALSADSTALAPERALALLDEVRAGKGSGAPLDRATAETEPARFLGHPALAVRGFAQDGASGSGLPTEATLFLGESARLFLIARSITRRPAGESVKIPMWELEAIAATFHLAAPGRASQG